MEFMHLRCQVCKKYFCCVSHRIDHENKNHMKPILPKLENTSKAHVSVLNIAQTQKSHKIIYKRKNNIINKKSLSRLVKYKTLAGNDFSIVKSSIIYLKNISSHFKMTEILERSIETNNICLSPTDNRDIGNSNNITKDELQSSNIISSNFNEKLIGIDIIKKQNMDSESDIVESQVNNSVKSVFGNKRRILLPTRRKNLKSNLSLSATTFESENYITQEFSPITSTISVATCSTVSSTNGSDISIKTSTPLVRDGAQCVIENSDYRNQVTKSESPVVLDFSPLSNYISPLTEKNSSNNYISPLTENSSSNNYISPLTVKNLSNNYIPVSPLTENNSSNNYISPLTEKNLSNNYISPLTENNSSNNYISPLTEKNLSNNYISPLTEHNSSKSLEAGTPTMNTPIQNFENVSNISHDSVVSIYQTPFGKAAVDNQTDPSKMKNYAVVTPLAGIMSKSAHKNHSPVGNEYSKLRKVTFFENASSNSKPLEPVEEVYSENDCSLDTKELAASSVKISEHKGILTTVAGIVSSAIQGLKSTWEWGHEISSQKRFLTPDKQSYPVPKRLRYSKQLILSPIRGRRPIRNNFNDSL